MRVQPERAGKMGSCQPTEVPDSAGFWPSLAFTQSGGEVRVCPQYLLGTVPSLGGPCVCRMRIRAGRTWARHLAKGANWRAQGY